MAGRRVPETQRYVTMINYTLAVVLLAVLTGYAVLAGADFGAGVWDLLAGSARRGAQARAVIEAVTGPVWEANHVWLIIALVVLWTSFPAVFAAIFSTLFVPLTLAAFGIVLRGVGFAFRPHLNSARLRIFFFIVLGLSLI